MISVHTNEDYVLHMLQDTISIFVFTGLGCSDCVGVETMIQHMEPRFKEVNFYLVQREELADLTKDLDVLGVPSLIAYRKGHEIMRFVSPFRKTEQEMSDFVSKCIEKEYANAKV